MHQVNILSFNIKWNYKTISLFVILLALPNLLGMINVATPWGFKIHFFQLAIFIAAFFKKISCGFSNIEYYLGNSSKLYIQK